jgi:competence protein ComEC
VVLEVFALVVLNNKECKPNFRRGLIASSLALAMFASLLSAQPASMKTLDIYVVDVEGGNATLFVAPSGESLLIDSGNAGAAAVRDADRILAAAHKARLARIDNLITTHTDRIPD